MIDSREFDELVPVSTTPVKKQTSVEILRDDFTRQIYCFDTSYSMSSAVADKKLMKSFSWSEDVMSAIRAGIKAAISKVNLAQASLDDLEFDLDKVVTVSHEDLAASQLDATDPDEELARQVIVFGLDQYFSVPYSFISTPIESKNRKTRMDIVKTVAARIIRERTSRNRAALDVISFSGAAKLLKSGTNTDELLKALEKLHPTGGTRTVEALKLAMRRVKIHPSKIGVSHIVVVSDANDCYEEELRAYYLPQFLEAGVVFDFILIMTADERVAYEESLKTGTKKYWYYMIAALKEVCEATGGEFAIVGNAEDLEKQLYLQGTRLCIPAAKVFPKK